MPERMCIVTREVKDEDALVRFVRSPEGEVVPDLARKLPGRGVWVSLERPKLVEAMRKGLFARGFHAQVKVPDDLADRVGSLLRRQIVAHLSLARKAGEAVSGATRVEEAIRKGHCALLFHVVGAAPDGMRKLNRLVDAKTQICGLLTPDDLDLAFGRANVVHAAVAAGGLAAKLSVYVTRTARFEGLEFQA